MGSDHGVARTDEDLELAVKIAADTTEDEPTSQLPPPKPSPPKPKAKPIIDLLNP